MGGSLFLGSESSSASPARTTFPQTSLNTTQLQQKLQKLTEELQSQTAARADLQKNVWRLERLVQKRDQEKAQLKQTIKALQSAPPSSPMTTERSIDRRAERESEQQLRVARAVAEHAVACIISNHTSISESRVEEYKKQCTAILCQNETPSNALKQLDELLYHISLHAPTGTVSAATPAPSSSSEEQNLRRQLEEQRAINARLEARVRRYKTQAKDARRSSSYCDHCQQLEEELDSLQHEKTTLVSYIQTYRQQQEQLNSNLHSMSDTVKQREEELARMKRALEKERHRRQEAEESVNGQKLTSQVDQLRLREDAQRNNQFLLEREEKIDQLTSQLSQKEDHLWQAESQLTALQLERDELLTSQQQQLQQDKTLRELLDRKREEVSELSNKLQECQHALTDTQHRLLTWEEVCTGLQVSVGLLNRTVDHKLQMLEDDVTSMGQQIRKTLGNPETESQS